ncbi:cytochrome c oxidase subunit 3 [Nocardia sp. NPDC055029]
MIGLARQEKSEKTVRLPGESGSWVLIFGEMFIFTSLFGVIVFYQARYPEIFADGQRDLAQGLGLLNTIVLLVGSILVIAATNAVRSAKYDSAGRLLVATMLTGLVFIAVKAAEWSLLIHEGWWIDSNQYWMVYFVITGAHLVHVVSAIGLLFVAFRRVRSGLPGRYDLALFETGACYWHMVDLLWLVIFPLFYLVN